CRGDSFAFLDDVEVVVEGSDLENLALRHAHFFGQRGEMPRREVAEAVLQLVQVLDQEVAAAGRIAQRFAHVGEQGRVHAASLRAAALALALFFAAGNDGNDPGLHFVLAWQPGVAHNRPAARAHWYFAPSISTGISVE